MPMQTETDFLQENDLHAFEQAMQEALQASKPLQGTKFMHMAITR